MTVSTEKTERQYAHPVSSQAVYRHILQTAFDLYSQWGIKSVSMDDVAAQSGVSKRTLYELFRNKEDLIAQGMAEGGKKFAALIEAARKRGNSALEIAMEIHRELIRNPNIGGSKIYLRDLKKYPGALEKMEQIRKTFFEDCMQLCRQGVDEGLFLPGLSYPIIALLAQKQVTASHSPKPSSDFSAAEIHSTVFFFFLRGICTEKGIRIVDRFMEQMEPGIIRRK